MTSPDVPPLEWRRLEIRGASGPIRNTYLVHGCSRVAVVLPGFMGGWSTPATYYPVLALLDRGFDALCLDSIYDEHPAPDVLKADSAAALEAARDAADYDQVLVVGKSLGTVAIAALLADGSLPAATPTIWLTPLLQNDATRGAIGSLTTPALFVIGTSDPSFDRPALERLEAGGHHVLVLDRANHGLSVDGDAAASADVPRRLVAAVQGYVDGMT